MMTMTAQRYLAHYGSQEAAVAAFAADLMADGPDHARGYTRENAVIATATAFGISIDRAYELIA